MKKNGSIKIIPLGGLDQIGMNITAFESDDSIIIVDCGLAFPSNDMLGIDLVIPDISYLKSHMSKIKGFVITHGHEDHIGALPYVLQQINVPVYGTRLTLALIEGKLRERGLDRLVKLNVQAFGDTVDFGDIKVEFIKTNHSRMQPRSRSSHRPVPSFTPATSRSTIHRSSVIRSICSASLSSVRKASWR